MELSMGHFQSFFKIMGGEGGRLWEHYEQEGNYKLVEQEMLKEKEATPKEFSYLTWYE